MKAHRSRIRSLLLTILLMFAFVPFMGAAMGIADGSNHAFAAGSVVIGEYNRGGNGGSIRAVNNKIVMDPVDLGTESSSSFLLGIQAFNGERLPLIINENVSIVDESPAEGAFSLGNCDWDFNANAAYFAVNFDASGISAGTYTANLKLSYVEKVTTNGYAIDGNNVITIPVSVTVTGTNPNYHEPVPDPKVRSLAVTPGNGFNELTWVPVDGCISYSIFRRDGKDNDSLSPELNRYEYLGIVYTAPDYFYHEEGYDDPVFVDHYAENNTVYSYIVIADGGSYAYSGEPSRSVSAKAGTGKRSKPAAPTNVEAFAGETSGGVTWYWDNRGGHEKPGDRYEPAENYDGNGYVHHFNVYLNGRLCRQVQQNASGDGRWSVSLDFPVQNSSYTVRVTAVDEDGNESVPSNYSVVTPEPDMDVRIDKHHALYHDGYYYDDTGLSIGFYGSGIESYDIWRKPAGSADASYQKTELPAYDETGEYNYTFFFDENVTEGKAYTYKVIGHSADGRVSEPYVFSVAAQQDEDAYYAAGGTDMSLSLWTADGESATVNLFDYGEGTYRLYRNGAVINTWSNYSGTINYTDTPPTDGNYSYHMTWTSKAIPSLTVRSNTVIFCRDTTDVDPDEIEGPPGQPRLTGWVTDDYYHTVKMSWTPSKSGSKPTGYIIYRTDGGEYNTFMWKNTSIHPLYGEPANDRYFSTSADRTSLDMRIAWSEDHYFHTAENDFISPHNLWVVAYNELGMSEPSNILSFSDVNGQAPVIQDTEEPGAPENVSAWTEWTDRDGSLGWLKGKLMVSWAEPDSGGTVKKYKITCTPNDGSQTVVMYTTPGDGYTNPYDIDMGTFIKCGVTYSITVTAVNNKGEKASAPPVTVTPEDSFAFKAESGGGRSAKLQWTGLRDSYGTEIEEYQIWRRDNKSAWTVVARKAGTVLSYTDSDLSPGTEYEYYVVAKETVSGKQHRSVTRTVTTTSRGDIASAPTNLSAANTTGCDVLLYWDPPTEGGLPSEYVLEYQLADKDPESDPWKSVYLQGTFGYSTGASIYSWEYDYPSDYYYSYFADLPGKTVRMRVRAQVYAQGWGEPSDPIVFTWPSGTRINADAPDPITPNVEAGDGKVTISWDKRTELGSNEGEATFYQLIRWGSNSAVTFTFPVKEGQTHFEYVDDDTDIVNGRTYTYELRPCNSYYMIDHYDNEYWYHPWCYMHQVTVTPNGETTDQKIAGNVVKFADELIDSRPADLGNMTEDYIRQVYELRDNYESLTAYQKKLIDSDKRTQIEELINAVVGYEAGQEHQTEINAVQTEIGKVPLTSQITENNLDASQEKVNAARKLYDALPEDAKPLVNNYSRLTEAEAKIKEIRREAEDTAAAAAVTADLEAIDLTALDGLDYDTLTEDIELNIANLRWEYDNLTKAQKEKVSPEGKNKLIQAENKINAILGIGHIHDMKTVAEKAPTCSVAGHIKYYECRKCGKKYTDPEGNSEITDAASLEIPADPQLHDWTEWKVKEGHDATCTSGGIEERDCSICHRHEERSFAARDHSWDAGEVTQEASEDKPGIVTFRCTRCPETRTATISYQQGSCTNMYEHQWGEGVETRAATCQVPGEIRSECQKCHVSIRYETTIDPLAHKWSDWTPVAGHEATCTQSGRSERHCLNDGCTETEIRVDEATGHDWQPADDASNVPATCGQAGSQVYECPKCHDKKTEILPATKEHDWGDWKVTVAPTCTEVGVEERVCRNDNTHREFRPAGPLGHDYVAVAGTARAATCTTAGKNADMECSRCHDYLTGGAVPARGHSWTSYVSQGATEFSTGVMTHVCTGCGSTYYTSIPAVVLPTDLPKVSISKPAAVKKKMTVKWKKPNKKNQKKIAGIEMRVTGPGYDRLFTAGKTKTSKKISGLKSKQKYTVRVRSYRYIGGVKHVSAWSGAKTVKIK